MTQITSARTLNNAFKIALLTMLTTLILNADPAYNEQALPTSGGDAVTMDKAWAFVGDADNDVVHAYKLDYSNFTWVEQSFPSSLKKGRFGASVSVSGEKLVVGAPDVETWRMEAHAITIPETFGTPVFTTITLQRTYEEPPLIFALASSDGGQPSAAKIRNRTNNSFEIVHAEPLNLDGAHAAMNISYFAIERGDHLLPDGTRIYAGEIETNKVRYDTSRFSNGDTVGWETINFSKSFASQPMVLAQTQTMNNEINNVPSQPSEPWITTAVRNVGIGSVELALERSEVVTANLVDQNETIAFLVMDVSTGSFSDVNNSVIDFESIYSAESIAGWDNGCFTIDFIASLFSTNPLVVATKNTLNGVDGGWLRSCSLSTSSIGLTVDEDQYTDSERAHTTERAGILAFSQDFAATFRQGEAYLYEYNGANWRLTETIEPTTFTEDMKFGASVGISASGANAQIVVGAPDANNSNGDIRGVVYPYSWDGTALTSRAVLQGNTVHSLAFGTVVDLKGDHLAIGAPKEESTSQNDFVGAAYMFDFNGTGWNAHPNVSNSRIKRNEPNEYLGINLAINNEGTVSMLASSFDSYIYSNNGTTWDQNYSKGVQNGGGVDIDDDVYLMAQADGRLSFFSEIDGDTTVPRPLNIPRIGSGSNAYTSVSLYKEQVLVNDPDGNQSVAIDVPCGIKPTHLIAYEWAMVSVPCGDGTATPNQIFGDELGTYGDNDNWVMYEQDGSNYSGTSASTIPVDPNAAMELGKGYWIIADQNMSIKADDNAITTRTDITRFTTQDANAAAGWHDVALPTLVSGEEKKIMLGNPFPRAFKWQSLEIGSGVLFQPFNNPAQTLFHQTGYVYDITQTGQPYRAITATGTPGISDEVKAYEGFWIKDLGGVNASGFKLAIPFMK